jgi:hypothetical protein
MIAGARVSLAVRTSWPTAIAAKFEQPPFEEQAKNQPMWSLLKDAWQQP